MPDYFEFNRAQAEAETDPFTAERYEQFHRYLPTAAKDILDVGCSTGRGGRVLRDRRPAVRLIALDCLAERLARLPPGIYDTTICSFSDRVGLPDRSLDAIVAGEFIEHLAPEDVDPTLRECARLLRPGGQLLLTTPNPGYLRNWLTGRTVLGGAHLSEHWPRDLRKRLRQAGFSAVRIRPSGKVTRYFGEHAPWLGLYGSYLAVAVRDADRGGKGG
jgi:SAM-dependent methyltransferase